MTVFGYARVSTEGQTLNGQVQELKAAGAGRVFREKASGVASNRNGLRRALDALSQGDVLLVTRLDRLARSTRDLLNTVAAIDEKGTGFRSLRDASEPSSQRLRRVPSQKPTGPSRYLRAGSKNASALVGAVVWASGPPIESRCQGRHSQTRLPSVGQYK
jgi:hypothetical protein